MHQKSRITGKKPVDLFRTHYKNRRKKVRRTVFRLSAVLIIGFFIILLSYRFYSYIAVSFEKGAIFPIKHIYVEGIDHIRADFIKKAFVNSDRSILTLNYDRIKKRLQKNRWFRAVAISRRFPDTVIVKIRERKPVIKLICGKERWLIDEAGYAFDKLTSKSEHYLLPSVYSSSCFGLKNDKNLYAKLIYTKTLLEKHFSIKRIDIIGKAVYYKLDAGPSVIVSTHQKRALIGRHIQQLVDFWKKAKKENRVEQIENISFVYKNQIVIRWKVAGYVK